MNVWNQYFYGPVATVRVFLLPKLVLTLLALDAWIAMSPHAALYGTTSFNVAHFAWLDAVQPVPTAGYHLFFVLGTGFAAMFLVFRGMLRPALIVLFPFYTYTWAMSRLDSYTHHYLLSTLLFCLMLWPKNGLAQGASRVANPDDRMSAWPYAMLGAAVGVIFFYCAMAKVDVEWRTGVTLIRMGGPELIYGPIQRLLEPVGLSRAQFWHLLSLSVIVLELLLAGCYVFAVRQDARPTRWTVLFGWIGFLLAMGLHIGNEFLQLSIRWFSYYMIAIAVVFFLPTRWLVRIAMPWRWLCTHGPQSLVGRPLAPRWMNLWFALAATGVACGVVVMVVSTIDLPGTLAVGVTAAAVCGAVCIGRAWLGQFQQLYATLASAVLTAVVMWSTFAVSSSQGVFFRHLGDERLILRAYSDAEAAYQKALHHLPARSEHVSEIHNNTGSICVARGDYSSAVEHFRKALTDRPDYVDAHKNLARAFVQLSRPKDATRHYRAACAKVPRDIQLAIELIRHLNEFESPDVAVRTARAIAADHPQSNQLQAQLARFWLQQKRMPLAIEGFLRAVELAPGDPRLRSDLGAALVMVGRLGEALRHCSVAVELDEQSFDARFNLATLLQKMNQDDRALPHFRWCVSERPDDGVARAGLGLSLLKTDQVSESVDQFQQAVYDEPDVASIRGNFAVALARAGRTADAIMEIEFAAELDPKDQKIRNNLRLLKQQDPRSPSVP